MSKSIIAMLVMLVLLVAALIIPIVQMSKWDPQLRDASAGRTQQGAGGQTSVGISGDARQQYVSSLDNADQLKQAFNGDNGRIRILAILSPTTASSREAARDLQQAVLDAKPDLDLAVHVVWIARRSGDTYDAARDASALLPDSRVNHYHGSDAAASYVADVMGYPGDQAWNLIMQFDNDAVWEPEMPAPRRYYHQLGPGHWLGEQNHATGNDLRNALAAMAAELGGWQF